MLASRIDHNCVPNGESYKITDRSRRFGDGLSITKGFVVAPAERVVTEPFTFTGLNIQLSNPNLETKHPIGVWLTDRDGKKERLLKMKYSDGTLHSIP